MKGILEYRDKRGYMTNYYLSGDGLKVLSDLKREFRRLLSIGQALPDMASIRVYDTGEDHCSIVFNQTYYADYEWVDFNSFTDRKIRGVV